MPLPTTRIHTFKEATLRKRGAEMEEPEELGGGGGEQKQKKERVLDRSQATGKSVCLLIVASFVSRSSFVAAINFGSAQILILLL